MSSPLSATHWNRHLVAKSQQPEGRSAFLKSYRVVLEQIGAHQPKGSADASGVVGPILGQGTAPPIVVAENGVEAERRTQLRKRFAPSLWSHRGGGHDSRGKIAQQYDDVRRQGVDDRDDFLDARDRRPRFANVRIGNRRDAQAKGGRPIGGANRAIGEVENEIGLNDPARGAEPRASGEKRASSLRKRRSAADQARSPAACGAGRPQAARLSSARNAGS